MDQEERCRPMIATRVFTRWEACPEAWQSMHHIASLVIDRCMAIFALLGSMRGRRIRTSHVIPKSDIGAILKLVCPCSGRRSVCAGSKGNVDVSAQSRSSAQDAAGQEDRGRGTRKLMGG